MEAELLPLRQEDVVHSKDQMVKAAQAAGLGAGENLTELFHNWIKWGLIDRPLQKEARRGGAGLWPQGQESLWLNLLRLRAKSDRLRIETLLNVPVSAWLLGFPDMQTRQAQRAWSEWLAREMRPKPDGTRSLRRRAVETAVDRLSDPAATPSQKRELRNQLEALRQSAPNLIVKRSDFVPVAVSAMASPKQSDPGVNDMAEATYSNAQLQSLAMQHSAVLSREKKPVQDFWDWARAYMLLTLSQYQADLPQLRQSHPERFFQSVTFDDFTNSACARLLLVFGVGIDARQRNLTPKSKEIPLPPTLPS